MIKENIKAMEKEIEEAKKEGYYVRNRKPNDFGGITGDAVGIDIIKAELQSYKQALADVKELIEKKFLEHKEVKEFYYLQQEILKELEE